MMNKKISLGVTIALIAVTAVLTLSVSIPIAMRNFNRTLDKATDLATMFDHLSEVDRIARQNYYVDINGQKLRNSLANGYISGLGDPYAVFLTKENYQKETLRLSGSWRGLGLEAAEKSTGEIVITYVQKGSPAAAAGLQSGDVVVSFGTEGLALKLDEVCNVFLNGTEAKFSINRNGTVHAFDISAATYPVSSVESRVIGTSTGYIRIKNFYANTPGQFRAELSALEAKGVQNYIFDVRGNAGGTLESATELIGAVVAKGTFAGSVDRNGVVTALESSGSIPFTKPAVTLVDDTTAAEAELFAAIMKKFNRVSIVGTKTMGHGMIRKMFPIDVDGSAVRMSVAQYQFIDNSTFDGSGLTPDVLSTLTSVQKDQFAFLTDVDDPQIAAALNTLNVGRLPEQTEPEQSEPGITDTESGTGTTK